MNKLRPHLRIMFAWSPGGMVLALCLILAWNMWLHPTQTFLTNFISAVVGILFFNAISWSYRQFLDKPDPVEKPTPIAPPKEKPRSSTHSNYESHN